jgi:fumarate hydratase subunit beta
MHELVTPLGDEIYSLHAGDTVYLTGMIYTARDEAHLRMQEEGIPFEPQGAVIYHCGPVIQDQKIIAAGPTTSARMNPLTAPMLNAGVRGLIGKGGMSAAVTEQLRGRGVYFSLTGGCAVLAATHMQLKGVYYPDLGMAEAIWELELKRLPLIVGIDAHGTSLFAAIDEQAKKAFKELYP